MGYGNMGKYQDLSGQTFGLLEVKRRLGQEYNKSRGLSSKHTYYECICSCGNTKTVRGTNLIEENVRSCGCATSLLQVGSLTFSSFNNYLVFETMVSRLYCKVASHNKTGVKGISRNGKSWRARIGLNKKLLDLGTVPTLEEAIDLRIEAEKEYFVPILNEAIRRGVKLNINSNSVPEHLKVGKTEDEIIRNYKEYMGITIME